ncbi:MAG: hypothetical protein GF309_09890, partial [Candidatus Lokiarchaeota archaeon]|nr:hypothetical protein [Candidatus Lokiarchaeota archaeon]
MDSEDALFGYPKKHTHRENNPHSPTFWMPDVTVTLKRDSMGTVATDTGKMIFGDLEKYAPLWSIDSEELRASDRRFISYGTWT